MPLAWRHESIPALSQHFEACLSSSRTVYGHQGSVTHATWSSGYRSQPQVYAGDQFIHVLSGELHAFLIDGLARRNSFVMRCGDFLRVPSMSVYWVVNKHADVCRLAVFRCPGVQWFSDLDLSAQGLFAEWESEEHRAPNATQGTNLVERAHYPVEAMEAMPLAPGAYSAGLLGVDDAIPLSRVDNPDGTWLSTKIVYGPGASVMKGTRPAGYHSRPHIHACEQINLVLKGNLWGYVVDPSGAPHAFEIGSGDFWRVPAMAVHWIFNRSADTCELIELHTPGLQDDPKLRSGAIPLLADYEPETARHRIVSNIYVETAPSLVADAELQASLTV